MRARGSLLAWLVRSDMWLQEGERLGLPVCRASARCQRATAGALRSVRTLHRQESDAYPQDIFVFVVGGVTYEEARAVALLNAANKQQRIILGSTCLLNSATFLAEFEKAATATA